MSSLFEFYVLQKKKKRQRLVASSRPAHNFTALSYEIYQFMDSVFLRSTA
jgi:hypothetical protein